ncbi:cofactor assembly- complex C (B6F [Striga hermonthica]|uniref:Cofactor assembly- complex C (B6F) n=1 Tax=Striga hermonthica TaxID=68872 RepID=A0A9N7N598_STRHE|nr:cofactor assembly- complex C (B6F [Striga hermonthica]
MADFSGRKTTRRVMSPTCRLLPLTDMGLSLIDVSDLWGTLFSGRRFFPHGFYFDRVLTRPRFAPPGRRVVARPYLLALAELDPATAKLAIGLLGPFLSAFGFLFIVRIVMSWYPKLPVEKFPYAIAYAPTEPLLVRTRKLIPPLAGVILL